MKRKDRITIVHLFFLVMLYFTFFLKESGTISTDTSFMITFMFIVTSFIVCYKSEEKRKCRECGINES